MHSFVFITQICIINVLKKKKYMKSFFEINEIYSKRKEKNVSFNRLIEANAFIDRIETLSLFFVHTVIWLKDVHFYHCLLEGTIVATFRLVLFPSASFKSSRSRVSLFYEIMARHFSRLLIFSRCWPMTLLWISSLLQPSYIFSLWLFINLHMWKHLEMHEINKY